MRWLKKTIRFAFAIIGGGLAALLLAICSFGLFYAYRTGAFARPSGVELSNPQQAVADARQLILDFQRTRENGQNSRWIEVDRLPQSLKIPKLRFAAVFTNHLNLVTGRNPDWTVGARIWAEDATVVHSDQTTKYSNVFFFSYCNDNPLSPSNQP